MGFEGAEVEFGDEGHAGDGFSRLLGESEKPLKARLLPPLRGFLYFAGDEAEGCADTELTSHIFVRQ